MNHIVRLSDYRREARRRKSRVYFTRAELSQLLSLYSVRVASGEWRDYAIDHAEGMALFSIFRHTHDRPIYTIAKHATAKGTKYTVFDGKSRIAGTATLGEALAVFPPPLMLISN
ncbi:MAG: DUF2794 domain-containing protein [Rhodospirillaceae bacterium]|nr:DUF2794 domain-containing protein [Rhodospirillaceae bacterium]